MKIKNERLISVEMSLSLRSGEGGIRTPGGVTLNGFQDRRNRPLCHLSLRLRCKVTTFFLFLQYLCKLFLNIFLFNFDATRWCLMLFLK